MFRKQIHIIPIPIRLVISFVVVAQLLRTPTLLAQTYEWKVIARPNLNPLLSVDFIDTLHGVCGVFGEPGALVTTDGGLSWDTARTVFAPRAMNLVNSLDGWASGTSGNGISDIGRTTDGGRSWETIREVVGEEFHGVAGLSRAKCICSGFMRPVSGADTAMIMMTTDAGLTLQRTLLDPVLRPGRIQFVDSLHGFTATEMPDSVLFRTTDGGSSWQRLGLPPYGDVAMTFLNAVDGWYRASPHIYRTRDGGQTWTRIYTAPGPNNDGFVAYTLAFTDSLYGWAFGGNVYMGYISEAIYHTTDGGYSWQKESEGLTNDLGVINDAVMLDRTHGWAVAADGRVLKYSPGPDAVGAESTEPTLPPHISLEQNYPNPFNNETTIRYGLPVRGFVDLRMIDVLGRTVIAIVHETQDAGTYQVHISSDNLSSGVYFARLISTTGIITRRVILLK